MGRQRIAVAHQAGERRLHVANVLLVLQQSNGALPGFLDRHYLVFFSRVPLTRVVLRNVERLGPSETS